ncbi:MAG: tRNA 2-thiocytidine biosynthesis protein TtcA [Oscillospiraceae bacterium]
MTRAEEIELSLTKKFRSVWGKFLKSVKEYNLIQENDKVAVCICGDCSSMALAKCMQRLQRYSKFPFEAVYISVSDDEHSRALIKNAELLELPLKVFCDKKHDAHTLCNYAKSLGCNKIALADNFDDIIQGNLMGILYKGEIKTKMPKLHSADFDNMEIIRPLYLVKGGDISAWEKYNNLELESCNDAVDSAEKQQAKALIQRFRNINPFIEYNLFRCMENVQLEKLLGYKKNGEYRSFLDDYPEP